MSGIWGEGDPVILLNMLSGKIVLLRQIMGGKEDEFDMQGYEAELRRREASQRKTRATPQDER